ncbi:MAG: hypothetical protein ACU0GG_04675 [Paracoccaceae bacterium]
MPDGSLEPFEKQVAQDRAALAASLEALSDTMAPERLKSELADAVETYGQQAWRLARCNPAAFALLGVGATLLATGLGQRDRTWSSRARRAVAPEDAMKGFDTRVAAADDKIRKQQAYEAVVQPASASKMQATLRKGLDRFPPEAQRRILAARTSALRLQEKIEARARSSAKQSACIVRERPIESAALAFGLGVLGAAFAPSTETEDKLLGAERDALMYAAREALNREMAGLRANMDDAVKTSADAAPTIPS